VVLKSFIEVGNRLADLGTSRELILEIADAVVAARTESTENDPAGTRGYRGWQMGTRRSRELHIGRDDDWTKDDTDQIASILNKARGLKIVVCNTDEGTCIEGAAPQNRSRKGAATERAVIKNQLSLLPFMDAPHPDSKVVVALRPSSAGSVLTYYLCVYHEGTDVRVELSCAIETVDGYFEKFGERIFVLGGEAGDESVKRKKPDEDGESDFDIPVTRKK
jgi:hypothetical protein